MTALLHAGQAQNLEIIEVLLGAGADLLVNDKVDSNI